ncbi:MAG: hypothetical protein KF726_28765 [Anaerolineae bacterium]|nr:hypothetical protein [Anaerolineae bacterium]
MKIDDIKLMYEHLFWAVKRILKTAAEVSQEQYVAPTGYQSLRRTLVHELDSMRADRISSQTYSVPVGSVTTETPAPKWDLNDGITESDLPTLEALVQRWQQEEDLMRAYLDTLHDEDMSGRVLRYNIPGNIVRERVLWHWLYSGAIHSAQHRSEAAEKLTAFGYSPGELDFTAFLNQYFNLEVEPE